MFSPSLPPYRVTTTSTESSLLKGFCTAALIRSDQLTWVAPTASAPAAVTPLMVRNRRRVRLSMILLNRSLTYSGAQAATAVNCAGSVSPASASFVRDDQASTPSNTRTPSTRALDFCNCPSSAFLASN